MKDVELGIIVSEDWWWKKCVSAIRALFVLSVSEMFELFCGKNTFEYFFFFFFGLQRSQGH